MKLFKVCLGANEEVFVVAENLRKAEELVLEERDKHYMYESSEINSVELYADSADRFGLLIQK